MSLYPQVGVGAIVFNGASVLLVKRGNEPAKGQWAVPGGRIRLGESLQEALKREIKEETNIEIEVGALIYAFDVIQKDEAGKVGLHYVVLDYEAKYLRGEIKAGDDAADVMWVDSETFKTLHINHRTKSLLQERYGFGM